MMLNFLDEIDIGQDTWTPGPDPPSGQMSADLGVLGPHPASDRPMPCVGLGFPADLKTILIVRGFRKGSLDSPGDFVPKKAFVEIGRRRAAA